MADAVTVGSGFFVVISLIFLIVEIRSNTEAVRAASYQELVATSNEYLLLVAADGDLAEIVTKGYQHPRDSLDALGRTRFFHYTRAIWRNFENAFYQRQHEVLGDGEWQMYEYLICGQYSFSPVYWERAHRASHSSAFIDMVLECSEGT